MDNKSTLKLKDIISRQEPYSVGNIGGAGDLVFMMKDYGVDAFVYDTGVYIIREGFGQKKQLRRAPSFYDAVKKLHSLGYKPSPYFRPGFRESYEKKHLDASERAQESIRFFPTYEKINVKDIQSQRSIQQRIPFQPPVLEQPIIYKQTPIFKQQMIGPQRSQAIELQYTNLFDNIRDANNAVLSLGSPTQFKRQRDYGIINPDEFSKFAHGFYNDVRQRDFELKNIVNPFAEAAKQKAKDDKAKAQRMKELTKAKEALAKAKQLQKKSGESNE